MPIELKMPQLGESVHEGTISRWLKQPGERVEKYEPLLEVATDKVESEVTAPEAGIVSQILVPEGQTVHVGTVLAVIDSGASAEHSSSRTTQAPALQTEVQATASASAAVQQSAEQTPVASATETSHGGTPRVSPLAARIAQDESIDLAMLSGSGPNGQITKDDVLRAVHERETGKQGDGETPGQESGGTGEQGSNGAFVAGMAPTAGFLSPRVQMLAAQLGVDVTRVLGTGRDGRVTARDVEAFAESRQTPPIPQPLPPQVGKGGQIPPTPPLAPPLPMWERRQGGEGSSLAQTQRPSPPTPFPEGEGGQKGTAPIELAPGDELVPLTLMRRTIAEHMVRSKHTAPHVTTVHEADVTRMVQFLQANFDGFRQRAGFNLTYTPFFVQAIVNALIAFPQVNVSFTEQGIIRRRAVNIGMAVALADGGLIVPVIKTADEKTLVRLARDVTDLATRARAKKVTSDETRGGTFTITNYGVFGGLLGTPVINQPEAAILGVGAVKKRPVVVESELGDSLAIRSMVYLALSFDHRAFDGATADQFMQRVVKELEHGAWSV